MFQKFFLTLALISSIYSINSVSYTQKAQAADAPNVAIRLLPYKTDVKGGETITVGIEEKIHSGWHTYWSNPGDSGTAARIKWSGLEGIEAAPIQWPVPQRMPMGPLVNFGYENQVVLLQDLTLPHDLPAGEQKITAEIDVLVCHEICIPEKHTASFTINGDQAPSPAAVESARTKLPLEMGWSSSIAEKDGDLVVTIDTDTPSAFSNLKSIELYPEEWGLIDNTQKTTATKQGSTLVLHHKRAERALADVPVSKIIIAYQDGGGQRKGVRLSTISDAGAPEKDDVTHSTSLIHAIFLALLGGMILNLMPCVFPVLSMKALSLVQLKDKDNDKARLHGLVYTAGILVCFGLIAGVLIALKAGGAQVGWGFQLQHPTVILFLAYLFFTLGLNLGGFFDISFSLVHAGDSLTRKSGLTGTFFTGVLATLVATPCTAPFMAGAMGYAITQPPVAAMAVFLSLGLGLALPYLALTFIPALRHAMPRPGLWMERFRQFLAFPMFGAACWLLWVLSQQIDHMGQFAALLGMLAIAFGIWLWKFKPVHHWGRFAFVIAAIAAFGFAGSTFFSIKPMKKSAEVVEAEIEEGQNWEEFSRAKLEDALKGDQPVFVNMTAAWCITCKVNEKVALATTETKKLFKDNGIKYMKGDWTNQNPEISHFLEEYGRSGVPIYVFYGPRDKTSGARPEPVVLPQLLTPGIVAKIINPQGDQ